VPDNDVIFQDQKQIYINHEWKIGNKIYLHYSYILTILSADFGSGYPGQCLNKRPC